LDGIAPTSGRGFGSGVDTGQWDRLTDTGTWDGRRLAELDSELERKAADPWAAADQTEMFWTGTRLAGDDPRWMDTPASAPRSPAVGYPVSAPRARSAAAAPRRRIDEAPLRRRGIENLEEDLLDSSPGGPLASMLYAAAWYLIPVLVFFGWLLTLDATIPVGCVTDVTGGGCESDRAKAMASLVAGAPRFGAALMSSLVIAVLLRWASGTWRARTVGLAAAVVGGGLSTVLLSIINGEPLGG
jgi:hypothetical protein